MMRKKAVLLLCSLLCVAMTACAGKKDADDEERQARKESMNEAEELFTEGRYQESLESWLGMLEGSTRDDADVYAGVVRCQIFLGNYKTAEDDIEYYVSAHKLSRNIGQLYLELYAHTGDHQYYKKGMEYCNNDRPDDEESMIPSAPQAFPEAGEYEQAVSVEFDEDDKKDTIYYCIMRYDPYDYSYYDNYKAAEWYEYTGSIELLPGVSILKAYKMHKGVAGDVAELYYSISYEGDTVKFTDPVMEEIAYTYVRKESISDVDLISMQKLNMEEWTEHGDDAGKKILRSLEDLQWMPNLTYLVLDERQAVKDYSPVSNCKKLRSLHISGFAGEDLSFLADLNDLKYLSICADKINSLSGVEECKGIQTIHLEGVSDPGQLELLKGLDKLLVLELYDCEATADTQIMDELRRELPMCDIKY